MEERDIANTSRDLAQPTLHDLSFPDIRNAYIDSPAVVTPVSMSKKIKKACFLVRLSP